MLPLDYYSVLTIWIWKFHQFFIKRLDHQLTYEISYRQVIHGVVNGRSKQVKV